MLTAWCLVFFSPNEVDSFLVGPFETKSQAIDFSREHPFPPTFVITVHPYIKIMGWVGKERKLNG